MVVVNESQSDAAFFRRDAHSFRDVSKFPSAVVVKQMHAVAHANGKISFAIIVKVAGSAAQPAATQSYSRVAGFILEFSAARVVKKL